jgi:ribosomal protein S18 acetylase RimI-like enzyme
VVPDYTLRPANETDYQFLWSLRQLTMKDYVAKTGEWDDVDQERRFRDRWNPSKFHVIVQNDRDIGVVSIGEGAGGVYIGNIQILPEYQRLGIGTAIINSVLTDARKRNLPVTLTVLKVNPARRLYERLGFRISGVNETHYAMHAAPRPLGVIQPTVRLPELPAEDELS